MQGKRTPEKKKKTRERDGEVEKKTDAFEGEPRRQAKEKGRLHGK